MASTNPYAEGKERILFVYDTAMAFHIHFCLTIKTEGWGGCLLSTIEYGKAESACCHDINGLTLWFLNLFNLFLVSFKVCI